MTIRSVERVTNPHDTRSSDVRSAPSGSATAYIVAIGLITALVPLNRLWAAQAVLTILLLVVPGVIFLRMLRVPGRVVSSFPVYVPCASIVVLYAAGLAANFVGPLLGDPAPLRTLPLLCCIVSLCILMLAASFRVPQSVEISWTLFSQPVRRYLPLMVPLISAAGALRLNAGHSNFVAVIAIVISIILVVVSIFRAQKVDKTALCIIIFALALAATWSFSLRGDPLNAFDIATEYQRLHQTIVAGIWHTSHIDDAYGAMVSVTVMPAELHFLTGVTPLMIFKLVYPCVYAFFPVATFSIARTILPRSLSFVAAAFVVGQYSFAEISGFARQEIALVVFVSLIMVMFDARIPRCSQWLLSAFFGISLVLSHYSSTYLAVTIVGLIIMIQFIVSFFRDVPHVSGAVLIGFISLLSCTLIWYGPVTHSATGVRQLFQSLQTQGLNVLPNRKPGESVVLAYLNGNTRTPISAAHYSALVHREYALHKTYVTPLESAGLSKYALKNSAVPTPPVKLSPLYNGLGDCLLLILQIGNLLAGFGALLLVVRRRTSRIARQVALAALAILLILTVLRFSGTLAVAYGEERAQLQGMSILAVMLCSFLRDAILKRPEWGRRVLSLITVCTAIVFINTTYLLAAVAGGQISDNLANSGADYEYFYTSAPELASAEWLVHRIRPGQLVYADEYGQVPISEVADISKGLMLDITPLTLNQHAWVYASQVNTLDGRAFAIYSENLATYAFPALYLHNFYNLVYTNGSSEVFHR